LLTGAYGDPLEVLVLTILSQASNDRNAALAYARLRQEFPTWDRVAQAPAEELARAIAPAGLGPQKAGHIQQCLRRIVDTAGVLDLSWLEATPVDRAYAYLLELPGVGPKTAACVLLFGLGKPAFPVDTHVARVARRLGLADERAPAGRIQADLERLVAPADAHDLHVALIHHGRTVCRARRPDCAGCMLVGACTYGKDSVDRAQKT
jgi:endonuclease-3